MLVLLSLKVIGSLGHKKGVNMSVNEELFGKCEVAIVKAFPVFGLL